MDAALLNSPTALIVNSFFISSSAIKALNLAVSNIPAIPITFVLLNLDVIDIIDGMTTKPFGKGPFYPGTGVGGHCIAVDPEWLNSAAKKRGYVSKFIELSRLTNNNMPEYTVSLLKKALTFSCTNGIRV